jgi:hypothetical protein
MPDELPPPSPDEPKPQRSGEEREWLIKSLNRGRRSAGDAAAKPEVERPRKVSRSGGHPPGPKRMFHPDGRFCEESGQRFDYVFPELLDDPAIPPWVFERVPFLLRGTNCRFQPRRATREGERVVVGLRYGHGDLPRGSGQNQG